MKVSWIVSLVIFIVCLMYIGHLQISFKPFSIQLPYWHRSLGVFLLVIGVYVFSLGEYASGYEKGLDKGVDKVIEALKEKEQSK